MFKFMKSKKGFSLVELMIVVVIMAILVAVAVPIFNSVTGNSRAKTCIDNQRSIISTLNNALLEKNVTSTNALTFYVINYPDAADAAKKKGYFGSRDGATAFPSDKVFSSTEISALFQTPPYCPVDNSAIEVKIEPSAAADGTATITTKCMDNNDAAAKNPHILK